MFWFTYQTQRHCLQVWNNMAHWHSESTKLFHTSTLACGNHPYLKYHHGQRLIPVQGGRHLCFWKIDSYFRFKEDCMKYSLAISCWKLLKLHLLIYPSLFPHVLWLLRITLSKSGHVSFHSFFIFFFFSPSSFLAPATSQWYVIRHLRMWFNEPFSLCQNQVVDYCNEHRRIAEKHRWWLKNS